MNRILFFIVAFSFPFKAGGQMLPLWDQYYNNNIVINPAFAGSHDALSATTFYRDQWVGFRGSPKNQCLSVHAPVDGTVGLGLSIESNSIGVYRTTNLMGNYAYRMDYGTGRLSFGLGFGASMFNINWNEISAADPDDVLLFNDHRARIFPNFSIGTFFYADRYFFGFSLPLFLSHEYKPETGRYVIRNRFSGHNYFLMGGYSFNLRAETDIFPSVLIKYNNDHAIQIDLNARVILQDMIWFGLGYRSSSSLTGLLQYQVNPRFRAGYSCSFDLSPIGRYSNGSHEVMLNYIFNFSKDLVSPRHFGLY